MVLNGVSRLFHIKIVKGQDSDDERDEPESLPADFVSPRTQKYQKTNKEFDETFSKSRLAVSNAVEV